MAVIHINIVLAFSLFAFASGNLSKYITICKHDDPELNECVRNSAQQLFQNIQGGMKEFEIPSTEPLRIPKIVVEQGQGNGRLVLTFSDAKLYGINRLKVTNVRNDPDEYSLDARATVDALSVISDYDIKGRLLLLPITGNGYSNITYLNSNVTLSLRGKPYEESGKTYMKIKEFKVKVYPRSGRIRLDNLFNGNKQLGETMNTFLNENFLEVIKELGPTVEEALSSLFSDLGARIYNKVPYNELYPTS